MPKRLVLIFNHFEQEHFGKDVFLVPYYLGKALGCDVTIVYPKTSTNAVFPEVFRGVKLQPLACDSRLKRFLNDRISQDSGLFYPYLVANARKIDYLILIHAWGTTFGLSRLYKILNPKGRLYLKLDGVYLPLKWLKPSASLIGRLQYHTALKLKDYVDCVSIETRDDYDRILSSSLPQMQFGDKLVYVPNGIDEDGIKGLGVSERKFSDKEDIILTVGRLGTRQKDTGMLLNAIDGVDLRGWKVVLVGPIEDDFKPIIDRFYDRNPDKRTNVIFTGSVYDKASLFDLYTRAKVFVLTSRWESSGLVLGEAYRFRDYLISTPVGAASDIIGDSKYGMYVGIEDPSALRLAIQDIISGTKAIDVYSDSDTKSISYEQALLPVTSLLAQNRI